MRTIRALLAGGVLLAALTGCGGSIGGTPDAAPAPAAAPSPETPEPTGPAPSTEPAEPAGFAREAACELLTRAEAEAMIGMGLADGVPSGGGDTALCMYTAPPTGPIGQVETFIGAGAQKYYDVDVQLGHEFVEIDGLGDEAHHEDGAIFVRVGATWAGIRLVSLSGADSKDALVAAARLVVDRL